MAEMISSTGIIDMAVKSNSNVDISPASLLVHNSFSSNNYKASLLNMKDLRSGDDIAETVEPNNYNEVNSSNFPTTSPSASTFRCERCDNFETNSRAALLLHVVQCLSSHACLRNDDNEIDKRTVKDKLPGNCNGSAAANSETGSQHTSSSSTSSSSSTTNSNNTSARKVFECDVCNMKFSNGANMRRHKMRHTGVKPYECRVCQKRFFRKDHLAEHFTTHTKTLPYHCPICNRGFQRQIAMRAHFQNEHVGQHDLVKTCPLCSYRAGSMKSLRIHFFNRHGIDLDNPGSCGTSSLLLALESQASQAAAAAAASFVPNLTGMNSASTAATATATNIGNNNSLPNQNQQSDSSESQRSVENATPPMHFLTPHVEISTVADNISENALNDNLNDGESESNPEPSLLLEGNVKTPTHTSTTAFNSEKVTKKIMHDNAPSISLIPIKQEIICNESFNENGNNLEVNMNDNIDREFSNSNSTLTSLIKVSPLKSLLREDLKRRICAKANSRMSRNSANAENNNLSGGNTSNGNSTCSSTPICNGTITSTGLETDSVLLVNRKQILTCLFCGIDFPDETLYFLHKGCHCESNPWKCNICGEQLNNVYEFNSHLLSKSHQ